MQRLVDGLPSPLTLLRVGLVVFVLVWLFGPYTLRSAVPIWLPFLIALGLELHFFIGGLRPAPARRADRGPQADDRERYGYVDDAESCCSSARETRSFGFPIRARRTRN